MRKNKKLILGIALAIVLILIILIIINFKTITRKINTINLSALSNSNQTNTNTENLSENNSTQNSNNNSSNESQSNSQISTFATSNDLSLEEKVTQANNIGKDVDTSKWDLTKVNIVYDKTGIPVPVPKGYTASNVESEMYVNGLNTIKTGTKTELELSSTGDYPWTQNDDDIWVSGNKGVVSTTSTLTSNEFTIGENGGHLTINWTVSCQYQYAHLYAIITNVNTDEQIRSSNIENVKYGTAYANLIYTTFDQELSAGTYKLEINYYKNSSTNTSGLDSGYVKSANIINYDQTGTDQVTNHQYGGFVIYKGTDAVDESNLETAKKTRNQWVWVPVPDISRIYETDAESKEKSKLYNFTATSRIKMTNSNYEPGIVSFSDDEKKFARYRLQGMTKQKLLQEMQSQFEETIDSITKYGGFWIGRYEAGNISQAIPVVQKMNTDIISQTWYTMYLKLQRIDTSENVKTSMIYGCLWDETLQWFVDTGRLKQDELVVSNSWGNYNDTTFEYTATDGNISIKSLKSGTKIPSGSTEYTNANNIYDMAGNVYDWTLEVFNPYGRKLRGGFYGAYASSDPSSGRNYSDPYKSDTAFGFRAYLHIK